MKATFVPFVNQASRGTGLRGPDFQVIWANSFGKANNKDNLVRDRINGFSTTTRLWVVRFSPLPSPPTPPPPPSPPKTKQQHYKIQIRPETGEEDPFRECTTEIPISLYVFFVDTILNVTLSILRLKTEVLNTDIVLRQKISF